MSTIVKILLALALLMLIPLGDGLNRMARTGGRYTPRLPDWLQNLLHRKNRK